MIDAMKYVLSTTFLLLFLTGHTAFGQGKADKAYIKSNTNVQELLKMADSMRLLSNSEHERMQAFDTVIVYDNGKKAYLTGVDEQGFPIYDEDDNQTAGRTSNVNLIWQGSGVDLSGCNIEIGHWEAGGLALMTHQEYDGRITHAEREPTSSHASHTAGTMIGRGAMAEARGMAPCATIVSRRSRGDYMEMAEFAANGGLLSNHSYSRDNPRGIIPLYGMYNRGAQTLDEVLFNAPYLTSFKSASNHRNDGVNIDDGGYDLVFDAATAKNNITVGAINDLTGYNGPEGVLFHEGSAWGPTDDWRIKPDLSANGVELYSASNESDEAYGVKSGTSMSTPVVTGTSALLQEYYHNRNGIYMKSATLKALLLGTTLELGEHDGPDFQNGWGLLNAETAAVVIKRDHNGSNIRELSLSNGETYTTTFESDGVTALSLTMVWTDPAGEPVMGTDNLQPMLVNDLDVRITGNGSTYIISGTM